MSARFPTVRKRQTKQREAILRAFRETRRPLSVEEVHAIAKDFTARLGLRTVYRNLQELAAEGVILGIDYPGQPIRYELFTGSHRPHFICNRCQKIFILEGETPEVTIPTPSYLEITGQELIFYGRCKRDPCPELTGQHDRKPGEALRLPMDEREGPRRLKGDGTDAKK